MCKFVGQEASDDTVKKARDSNKSYWMLPMIEKHPEQHPKYIIEGHDHPQNIIQGCGQAKAAGPIKK